MRKNPWKIVKNAMDMWPVYGIFAIVTAVMVLGSGGVWLHVLYAWLTVGTLVGTIYGVLCFHEFVTNKAHEWERDEYVRSVNNRNILDD